METKNFQWEKFKMSCKEKGSKVYDWCCRHRETLIVMIPVLVSGSIELVKIVSRRSNINEDRYLKENFVYDRSQGHYYELKRQPTATEWRLIDHRKSEGELLGDILNDMRILK